MKEKRILYQFQQSTITLLSHIFHTYPINSISRSQHHIPKIRFDQQFGGPISPQFYQMKQNLRLQHPDYHLLQQNRTKLPAYSHNDLVVHLIKTNNIVLVSGETG